MILYIFIKIDGNQINVNLFHFQNVIKRKWNNCLLFFIGKQSAETIGPRLWFFINFVN